MRPNSLARTAQTTSSQSPRFRHQLVEVAKRLKLELAVYRAVLRHSQTPWQAKVLLGAAVGYLLLPFDLIPDFLPIVGHLDDAIIVPGLVVAASRWIPESVFAECRAFVHGTEAA